MKRLAGKLLMNGMVLWARFEAAVMPVSWLYAMGRFSARQIVRRVPGMRRGLLDNAARLLGPGSTEAERERLAVQVVTNFSRLFVTLLTAPKEYPATSELIDTMVGREHGERAIEAERGVIAITLHMGNYELGAMVFKERFQPAALVYRRDPYGLVEKMRSRSRKVSQVEEITTDDQWFGVRVLDVLRRKGSVLVAGDIGFDGEAVGVDYPFLGGRASFHDWPARLSRSSGAPLLPSFVIWDRDCEAYRLVLEPPILPEEHDDVDSMMRALIAVYERYVSRYPDQWLILHRYWREESPGSAKSSSVSGTS